MTYDAMVRRLIDNGAHLSISVSGGKDSQALVRRVGGLTARCEIVHADLGRAEWKQTPGHVRKIAREAGLPLEVVRRVKGDLVSRIEDRLNSIASDGSGRVAKPFWPIAAQRYCTSDMKRGPIQKRHRAIGKNECIVSAIGVRAEESSARAKKQVASVNQALTTKRLRGLPLDEAVKRWDGIGRLAIDWHPIISWTENDVWVCLGSSLADVNHRRKEWQVGRSVNALCGWDAHPAYVFGNQRLSCALCVLACSSDLENGAKHHPELLKRFVELEEETGYTFKDGFSLASLVSPPPQNS